MKQALLIITFLILSINSYAGKMMFGKEQSINQIEPALEIPLMDEEGYLLTDSIGNQINGNLAYLTETQFFIAGVWVTDQGYVIADGADRYYSISEEAQTQIEEYVGQPFPTYKLSTLDYLVGYSLWLILLGTGIFYGIKDFIQKKRNEKALE